MGSVFIGTYKGHLAYTYSREFARIYLKSITETRSRHNLPSRLRDILSRKEKEGMLGGGKK